MVKRKQIYLDEDMIEVIEVIAEKKGISQSEIIRRSLRGYIRKAQKEGEISDPLLEVIGLGKSEITDGAVEHDKYIY
ncbi:MAG TPA: CopG family transcriptional regulator [Halanaerobiales bacterium]|nr:CopG family transcriptional regulator [Halanaerobiales bacterium]